MNFKLWLEAEAHIDNIGDALFQSVKYTLNGQWKLMADTDFGFAAPWKMQDYRRIILQGKDVVMSEDFFEVYIAMNVYKRPEKDFEKVDPNKKRKLNSPNWPDWIEDHKQWQKVSNYDTKTGHELVFFKLSIIGRRPDKLPKHHPLINSEPVTTQRDQTIKLKTPFEVANFIKKCIDNYYRRWDNDGGSDDDDVNFDPSPTTPSRLQPVGT